MDRDLTEEVESALVEVQRYLLDQIPPLNASDVIETLARQPPELLMRQINREADAGPVGSRPGDPARGG